MNERIQTEMVSRRKALSLLGLGAALGFALSAALEPLEAEAQEATGTTARPLQQPGRTGCNGDQHDAPLAISDGTHAAPVNPRLRPPQHLHRNRGSVCFRTSDRAI